jgi:prophage regulatory protein
MSLRPRTAQEKQDNRKYILRMPQVLEQVNLSRATVYKMIRRSEFPQPVQIGQRSVGWLPEEVNSWLRSRPHAPPRTGAAAPE